MRPIGDRAGDYPTSHDASWSREDADRLRNVELTLVKIGTQVEQFVADLHDTRTKVESLERTRERSLGGKAERQAWSAALSAGAGLLSGLAGAYAAIHSGIFK